MKILVLVAILLLASSCHGQCTQEYTVVDGDTCVSISFDNQISTDDFTAFNPDVDCDNPLQAGEQVCIAVEVTSPPVSSDCTDIYTVTSGDTCASISFDNQISTDDFTAFNPDVDCNNLQDGQQVCLAIGLSSSGTINPTEEEQNGSSNEEEQNPSEEEQNSSTSEEEQTTGGSEEESVTNGEEQNPSEEEQNSSTSEEEQTTGSNEEVENLEIAEEELNGGNTEEEQNNANSEEENTSGEEENESNNEVEVVGSGAPEEDLELTPEQYAFAKEVIDAHMFYRDQYYSAPRMEWNVTLEKSATAWAQYLADNNLMVHTTDFSYGENLAGTNGAVETPTWYVDTWGAEGKNFVNGSRVFNDSDSITGDLSAVGHFTQVIWKNSTNLGCGMVTSGEVTRFVCQYHKTGNNIGELIY